MSAPLNRMKKTEILWLHNHKCRHSKTYIEHHNCYLTEQPQPPEKIGFFDIEAYGYGRAFKAVNSLMLCYCIKPVGEDKVITGVNSRKDILDVSDKNLTIKMLKDLKKFDKIFTYYGTRYDLPFIRTRALINKLDFIEYGELLHRDIYYVVRSKLLLERSTQQNAGRLILGKSNKTKFSPEIWARAFQGDRKCLDKIVDHCQRDVSELEQIHKVMKKFTMKNSRSI